MEFYTGSSKQHIVGYGSNSVVVSAPAHDTYYHQSHEPTRVVVRPVNRIIETHHYIPVAMVSRSLNSDQPRQRQNTAPAILDPFRAEQYQPSQGTSAKIPHYNAFHDPHMKEYFKRKFKGRFRSAHNRLQSDHLYRITVKTADVKDAGTNAKVFLSIFGSRDRICRKYLSRESMIRGQTQLSVSLSRLDRDLDNDIYNVVYKRGATDTFFIRSCNLGNLQRIRLEHTGLLVEQAWLCEFVLITNVRTSRSWYFPCNVWLSLFEPGDGSLSVELYPRSGGLRDNNTLRDRPESTEYEFTVVTGDGRGAGTDANVFITLFSEDGYKTGKIHLKKSQNNSNPFERGQSDVFRVRGEYIGDLVKLRIEHDNSGRAPGWFLERITIVDLFEPKVRYYGSCKRWLAKNEDDGQISRDIILKKNIEGTASRIPYIITVYTGDKSNAGTDAKVYIRMHRKGAESGKIFLMNGKFERKSVDEIIIDGPEDFSPLSALDIGHDNTGAGPGWFLHKVVVDCPTTGITQTFLCDQWLASDEGDHLIERTLREDKSLRKNRPPMVPWYVWIYTSDVTFAGTDAQVFITLYGRDGRSAETQLNNKSDPFEQGKCDEFKRSFTEVGIPYKLRVRHDNSGSLASWHLDRIEMENLLTRDRYVFRCGRWLSKNEDDKQIIRELPADGPGIEKPLPVTKYNVDVYTGDQRNAGTDANVFINIFGKIGDTGERPLEYSSSNKNKFERKQVDKFSIEAVSLKQIEKIIIGHDNTGTGPGWFLDKVVVTPQDPRYKEATFVCQRWFAKDEDDGRIVRELTLNGSEILDQTRYVFKVKTGTDSGAGTDADVYVQLFGKKGETDKVRLQASENTKNKFEAGQTDIFNLDMGDIGKIQRLKIGHNDKGIGSAWYLDWVELSIPSRGEVYRFTCHRWLDAKKGDKKIEVELEPSDFSKREKMIPYEIHVFTGKELGAGTDANVFIQIYGDGKKTEEMQLRNRSDNFENGKEDVFKIEGMDVGQIEKIRIGHDNKKSRAAWFLEKVLIRRHLDQDDDRKRREFRSSRSHRMSQISATDPNVEEYWFFCQKWFDADKGDRQIVRELLPTDARGNILSDRQEVQYEVHVFTGDEFGAGTDANVFLTMFGSFGDSGERPLNKSRKGGNKFERNQEDIFDISVVHLGKLSKIRIGHDNSGGGAAWFLDRVEILDPLKNKMYLFPCKKWFSEKDDDGMIVRELPALDNSNASMAAARMGSSQDIGLERKALLTTFLVKVVTGDKLGSGTDSKVYLIIYGKKDDTGKIPLVRSKTHKDPFERGHTDTFEIEASDIGQPKKIRIGREKGGFNDDWFLERVEIDVPKLGRQWEFPCGKWISESKGDRQLEVELYPEHAADIEYNPRVPYEIKVYTSKISGAGTDANVFIQIYGEDACTEETTLYEKTDRPGKFQTGSVDTVTLELDDVGETIKKIRVGHDNKGWGAAWHLDHIEIRRIVTDKKTATFIFPCNRWFSKSDDDKQIVRELLPETVVEEKLDSSGRINKREKDVKHQLEMKTYQVDVYTGDVVSAGTNANVFLTLFGDKGDSGERELRHSETHRDKFERKHMDRFRIECGDLGNIFKAKIRHDDAGISADWYLDRIEVIHDIDTFIFHCEQWIRKSGDVKPEKTLYEKDYQGSRSSVGTVKRSIGGSVASFGSNANSQQADPFRQNQRRNRMAAIAEDNRDSSVERIAYTVRVKTGDVPDAGTTADVMITLNGKGRKSTQKIPLLLSNNRKFERGKTEVFSLDEPDVGDLKSIEIEHNGRTKSEGWFLDSIIIEIPTKGKVYQFTCKRWLSKEEDDGLTRLVLEVDEAGKGSFRPLIPYDVTFYTGDVDNAGIDCDVSLKLFGTNGSSSEHVIKKEEGYFERAAIDAFQCELDDVGSLVKVLVKIIPKSKRDRKNWYLEKITISKPGKSREPEDFLFGWNDWISRDQDFTAEIPITKGSRALMKKTTYIITTKTSNIDGASSDSDVFITLSGEFGDSKEFELTTSSEHTNKFERDNQDIFKFENILSLGTLTKVRVRIEESFFKGPWHLEYVSVHDEAANKTYTFPCGKWLSLKKDDKQLVRELLCEDDSSQRRLSSKNARGEIPYEVEIITSDKDEAGTTQHGWIILEGQKRRSPKFLMKNTENKKILRRGASDTFTFYSRPLGDLENIVLGHAERTDYPLKTREGRKSQWHVSHVTITDASTGIKYEFPIRKWIRLDEDGDTFECTDRKEDNISKQLHRKTVKYEVVVHTGDRSGAGTDANVYIILYGTLGDTGKRHLEQKGRNLFEQGQIDKFEIEALDLGEITKLHIEHDNKNFFADWYLDKVEVKNLHTSDAVVFPCDRWLSKDKGDREIQCDLLPFKSS